MVDAEEHGGLRQSIGRVAEATPYSERQFRIRREVVLCSDGQGRAVYWGKSEKGQVRNRLQR